MSIAATNDAVVLSWPAGCPEWRLETTPSLDEPSGWAPVTNLTLLDGVARLVSIDPLNASARFYRLKKISP